MSDPRIDDAWRPIETAPLDETILLAKQIDAADPENEIEEYWHVCSGFWLADAEGSGWIGDDGEMHPSHWMPLPLPPKEAP